MNSISVLHQSSTPTRRKPTPQETHRYGNGQAVQEHHISYGSINVSAVLQQLLQSTGEPVTTQVNALGADVLFCYNDTLSIECCSQQVTTTLHSIFSGHRQINNTLKQKKCEGRWIVEIQRNYTDDKLIQDVCALLETMPSTAIAAAFHGIDNKGICITPIHDGEQWRNAMDKSGNIYDELYSDGRQKPSSVMMNRGALLYVEGPWFYPYEVMEHAFDVLEHEHNTANEKSTLIAIDANEFASDVEGVQHRIAAMMARRKMPHVAGVLCLQYTRWSKRGGNVVVQLLPNPSSCVELPRRFVEVLQQQRAGV